MSHSENDMDRQVKRHKGPLIGFIAIGAFVAVILVWWLGSVVGDAEDATDADATEGTALSITGPDNSEADAAPASDAPAEGAETPSATD